MQDSSRLLLLIDSTLYALHAGPGTSNILMAPFLGCGNGSIFLLLSASLRTDQLVVALGFRLSKDHAALAGRRDSLCCATSSYSVGSCCFSLGFLTRYFRLCGSSIRRDLRFAVKASPKTVTVIAGAR